VAVSEYRWPAVDQFIGRRAELARLEAWWRELPVQSQGMNLYGRRRVGKSWLFRRFAHGKPAIILVAERTTPAQQLTKIAEQLEPHLGLRPEIRDVGELFRILFQFTRRGRALVVIDEFPYLLGNTASAISGALSSIQAVIEQHRDSSLAKIMVCGSTVSQMEDLQSEKNPLHGRFDRFVLQPLGFHESREFMPDLDIVEQFERYSVAGGMPRYLHTLCSGDLERTLASKVVDSNSPLFNEPLSLLQSELREPNAYLAILEALAVKPTDVGVIADAVGLTSKSLSPYLENLRAMRLASRRLPVGADSTSRSGQWECPDHFLRFWFRFVRPFQTDLEAGSDATAHVRNHIRPHLPEHVSLVFEDVVRRWIRQTWGAAGNVGAWWGNSLNHERAAKRRQTEEIDAVGLSAKQVVVVAEAKWTNKAMPLQVLEDLRNYKLPAMNQAGFRSSTDHCIVLTSRSGFTAGLQKASDADSRIRLIDAADLLSELR